VSAPKLLGCVLAAFALFPAWNLIIIDLCGLALGNRGPSGLAVYIAVVIDAALVAALARTAIRRRRTGRGRDDLADH